MSLSQPLDPNAVAAADDRFYRTHPEMVADDGTRMPISASASDQAKMRQEWVAYYKDEIADTAPATDNAGSQGSPSPDPDEQEPENQGGDDPCQHCATGPEFEEEPTVTVRISVFFDGTGNNRANVESKLSKNSQSNVEKMETTTKDKHPGYDHYTSVYVEGISTADGKNDDQISGGLGTGDRGIVPKVERGIALLLKAVDEVSDPVVKFHIDAFGFSRGAAAARTFIWSSIESNTTLLRRLIHRGVDMQCSVEAKFLGLYDTVSSYGLDHENDVEQLHLDKIYACSDIVQLAAAEEHRKNFQLTTIRQGTEIYLPGVHSDVGGGYPDMDKEENWQLVDIDRTFGMSDADEEMFERERKWLTDRGWYWDHQINPVNFSNELIANRSGIRNYYSRIPLQIMIERAQKAGVPFTGKAFDGEMHIKGIKEEEERNFLHSVDTKVRAAIADQSKIGSPSHWMQNQELWHRKLRNQYLHFSSRYGEKLYAHVPNWSTGEPVKGTRVRFTNDG